MWQNHNNLGKFKRYLPVSLARYLLLKTPYADFLRILQGRFPLDSLPLLLTAIPLAFF